MQSHSLMVEMHSCCRTGDFACINSHVAFSLQHVSGTTMPQHHTDLQEEQLLKELMPRSTSNLTQSDAAHHVPSDDQWLVSFQPSQLKLDSSTQTAELQDGVQLQVELQDQLSQLQSARELTAALPHSFYEQQQLIANWSGGHRGSCNNQSSQLRL